MGYPLKDNYAKGTLLHNISAEWLNTVARILNNLAMVGGMVSKDASGDNWEIQVQAEEVNVLTGVVRKADKIQLKYKPVIVLSVGTEAYTTLFDEDNLTEGVPTALTADVEALNFLKVTSLDEDGCPDATDWRKLGLVKISDVDISDTDLSTP